ncbi:unnamed protein product [Prunus brigantina]
MGHPGLVPWAVTICVVIVGLVPCAAQEIERFSEDTRNKVCMPKIGAQSSDLGRVSARFLVAISPIWSKTLLVQRLLHLYGRAYFIWA